VLGSSIGVVETIIIGQIINILAAAWIVAGPVIRLKEQPVMA
jgi:hypothetical protein